MNTTDHVFEKPTSQDSQGVLPRRLQAAYQINELIDEFQRTRIPVRRQAIVNQAIEHIVTNILPFLNVSELASIQARMAVWDRGE